ncbi:MAG: acyl-[ACP]--phospholipid O-acyltransferase [Magnetococcales bacterium]|nr:acyl-[ACP]--phospholipid O-acyltransferase [Magnetococcales bacterium]
MGHGAFHLLRQRRFLPLFVAQFFGAANDNLFKNALVILVVYRLGESSGMEPQLLVTAAAGLFILPFFLLSATAGQLADRFEKSGLIRLIKGVEVVMALLGGWALLSGYVPGLLLVLFLFGAHSTFFGPLKYAILPEHLPPEELIGANALIEGGTFLAILFGTIAGGTLILAESGPLWVSGLMLALAFSGLLAGYQVPRAHDGQTSVVIDYHFLRQTGRLIARIHSRRDLFLAVLGISWFWLVGATYLAQFPAFAKNVLHADEQVVTLMLTLFSVGIGAGSVLCGRLLGGEISARFVPVAAVGMTCFSFDLWLATHAVGQAEGALTGLGAFMSQPANWRILLDLMLLALCGGIYIVPLYTILQTRCDESVRARVIAANNVLNAAFMVVSALAGWVMLAKGFTIPQIFLAIALANLLVAVIICGLLPDVVLKGLLSRMLRLLYRVEVRGMEHLENIGERAVVVVNHVSFLDAVLMAVLMPHKPTFAINTQIAGHWWIKPFLALVEAFPLDPTNPMSLKGLIRAVQAGRVCVIFPEGRITVTGALMKVYEGPGMIADRAGAPVVPVRIDGAQYTPFSRLKGKVRLRWWPKITVTVLPPRRFEMPEELSGRQRRRRIGEALYEIMSDMMFETSNWRRTLFEALLEARHIHGGRAAVVEDIGRKPLTYNRMVLGSLMLGRALRTAGAPGEVVGMLLPNMAASALLFFALQAIGRVPAMLNFTTGAGNVLAACQAGAIRRVVTSRRFVEQARLEALVAALEGQVTLLYLEEVRASLDWRDTAHALMRLPLAASWHHRHLRGPDDPAVILFTSGSEGTPKGVVLSHANILANINQLAARVAFSSADCVCNALPIFHSFGLTGGLLLPLLSGIRVFLYPSPLHYRIVPELAYDINATILFGTDTFLTGYAKAASPYDFYSVRYVFAGAEKVREETRLLWMEKFGLRILEGYGATETAPVIAVNTPMHYRGGTVGRLLPGIAYRLEPVPGIAEGGRLHVKGPNVMLGYYRTDRPAQLEPPPRGWYDTGDIVSIDPEGFVRILGRAKRFAKIAGEMVPLGRVEEEIGLLAPGFRHGVVALPDARKGEQLLLVTEWAGVNRESLVQHFRQRGLPEWMVPKNVFVVDRLPLLGTGKTDYVALNTLARERADRLPEQA